MGRLSPHIAISAAVALLSSPVLAGEQCQGAVCVRDVFEDPAAYVEATNHTAAPVTMHLQFIQRRNLRPYPELPDTLVVPARSSRKLAQFLPIDPYMGISFRYSWAWVIGDITARHDPFVRYRMPFGGTEPRMLSQGVDGRFTHQGAHRYAFDFAMPIGTPILAARTGTVIRVSDGHTRHGLTDDFLSKANAVLVMHDDRTIASYAHLDPGAGVREGMRVRRGELIGFSGNTGFTTGPHLHFEVWKPLESGRLATLPIRFYNGASKGFVPGESAWYSPTCHSEGVPCKPGELGDTHRLPAAMQKDERGACQCANGSVITTHLPCRMVCPKR